jgi:hypothetical protein
LEAFMTNEPSDENAAPLPPEPAKDGELSDQQVESVSGGAGRTLQDCEGYAALTEKVLSKSPTLKSD